MSKNFIRFRKDSIVNAFKNLVHVKVNFLRDLRQLRRKKRGDEGKAAYNECGSGKNVLSF